MTSDSEIPAVTMTPSVSEIPPHQAPLELLLEADPNLEKVQNYLNNSRCFAAKRESQIVGICVLAPLGDGAWELMNIATLPERQGQGIGAQLLNHVINEMGQQSRRLEVGTGCFGYQLAFYQKAGFRADCIVKDFFLESYPEPIFENGIQHKDMFRLAIDF